MSFLSRIKSQFGSAPPFFTDPLTGWVFTGPSASGISVSPVTAIRCSAALACTKLISETVASFPLKMYRRRRDGGKDLAPQHPLYNVLHSQPNRWNTSYEWRETSMAHLLLWGRCHSEIVHGARGAVDQLIPLTPSRVQVETQNGQRKYRYMPPVVGAQERVLLEDEVFTINGLSLDGVVGLEPMQLAREAIGLSLAEEEYHARMFSNGAQLSGVLTHPTTLTAPARKNIEASLSERHTGLKKSWRLMLLEEGMKYTPMAMRARDAEALESRRFQIAEVCRPFRVPPHMIGDVTGSTSWGTGIEAQSIGFVVFTILSWLVRWEQAILRDLIIPREKDLYFSEFMLDGLLRGDTAARGEFYTQMFNIGVFSQNDIRVKENMNPIEGGDRHFVPLNMVPLDQVGQQQQADPEAGSERPALTGKTQATRLGQMIRFAADRLANKESVAARKAAAKFTLKEALTEWADEFYLTFAVDISENLQVPFDVAERFAMSAKAALLRARNVEAHLLELEVTRAACLTDLALGIAEEVTHAA